MTCECETVRVRMCSSENAGRRGQLTTIAKSSAHSVRRNVIVSGLLPREAVLQKSGRTSDLEVGDGELLELLVRHLVDRRSAPVGSAANHIIRSAIEGRTHARPVLRLMPARQALTRTASNARWNCKPTESKSAVRQG